MKTKNRIAALLLVIVIVAAACKQSVPKQVRYIPKDASAVFSINPKNLQDKLDKSHISLDSIMRAAVSEDTSMMLTQDDIKNSGIDLTSEVYIFISQSGSMMTGNKTATGIVAAMDKTSYFEAFVKKKMPSAQIKKESDYSYAMLKNGFVAGWNDDAVVMTNVSSYNTSTGDYNSNDEAASQKELTTLFTQKEDASMASVEQFRDAAKEKADMLFFASSNSSLSSVPFVGMSKASDLVKDMYTSGTINFEDGRVDMELTTFPNKTFADTLKKYAGPKADMSMVNKYPGTVTGYAVFSFDPKLIVAILNFIGFGQTANQFMQQQGFSLDDVIKAFKGDFAVVFSDVNSKQVEYYGYKSKSPTAKVLVNVAIGDKAAYDKVVSKMAEKGWMVQQNGQYVPKEMTEDSSGFSMSTDAKNILISSDAALLQQYKGGNSKAVVPSDIANKSNGTAVAFYVDIAGVLKGIGPDSANAESYNAAMQTFKDIIATTDNYGNDKIKGHIELRTVNDKENSLATLTRYFGSLSTTMKKMKEAGGMNDMDLEMPDSAAAMPVPDTSTMQEPQK